MLIPLNEPSNFRYIYINPETNRVHLLVPFIAGLDVSTDNTCKSDVELRAFFEGGAFKELKSYKSTLEFHLSLLKESDEHYRTKKERLEQINIYIEAVVSMRANYKAIVESFLSKPSNLYSIQLRPRVQDPMSRVVNPVFTINRENDSRGTPLSPLYNQMHEIFPRLLLGKPDPRTALIQETLKTLPENSSFEDIKHALKSTCSEQFKIDIDVESWIRPIPNQEGVKEV
jgi:SidC N-terminal domain